MKVRCESCTARYDIPSERVLGRVLKVRCSRCQYVMQVVGPTEAFDPSADPLPPTLTGVRALGAASSEHPLGGSLALEAQALWWAAVGGKPHGPYTRQEIFALIERGDVHARTRLWRAPWGEWERICEHPALRWAYERVVAQLGRDVAVMHGGGQADAFAAAGLVRDGEHYFPDPTLKSGWVVLDEETQRYLDTCAKRGWGLTLAEQRQLEPADLVAHRRATRPSVAPALAAACAALLLGFGGTVLFFEGTLGRLLS